MTARQINLVPQGESTQKIRYARIIAKLRIAEWIVNLSGQLRR